MSQRLRATRQIELGATRTERFLAFLQQEFGVSTGVTAVDASFRPGPGGKVATIVVYRTVEAIPAAASDAAYFTTQNGASHE